jgi:hypothetical protein
VGLHLYCVTPIEHLPRDVAGLDGAHVRGIEAGRVAIWASELDAPARASIESAQRHHAVVEAAMKLVTPVPLRFGQWLPDEEAVRLRAMARAADWEAQLAALRGTAEYTVRVLDPAVDAPARDVREAAGSGRAYLEAVAARRAARAQRFARGRAVAGEIEAAVAEYVVRTRVDALDTTHGLATIAFLVDRDAADRYRSALDRALASHPGLHFLASGPWPPWSFAT